MTKVTLKRLLQERLILLNLGQRRVAINDRVTKQHQCLERPHVQYLLVQNHDLVV